MSDEIELSEKLSSLIDDALHVGIEDIEDGGPLIPFVFAETGDERALARSIVPTGNDEWDLGASVEQARNSARARPQGADRVAIIYDARIDDKDGNKVDALIAEVFETDLPATLTLVLPYRPAGHADGFDILGEVELVEQSDPMW